MLKKEGKRVKYKSVIWGFPNSKGVIRRLEDQEIIEVVEWIGGEKPKSNFKGEDIYVLEFQDSKIVSSFRQLYLEVYEKCFLDFAYMYKRHDKKNEKNIYDARDIFNLSFNYIVTLYMEKSVDLLLMANIPHEGIDVLFYEIAKVLNIKTVVLYQSIVPNYIHCMNNSEDFGNYTDSSLILSEKEEGFILSKNAKKQPIYMKGIKPYRISFFSVLKYLVRHKSPQWYWNYLRYKKYQADLQDIIRESGKEVKYVYFPLQLNPELTTMPLGGKFDDQLLSIEYLSNILPKGWKIYLKENPKQTEFMRGKYFFRRVRRLENVMFVPGNTNTFELIENSEFVANVTGTVGWEAIGMGKNALVFGRAWYRKLPGVFEYHDNFDIEEILSYSIDHQELESEVATLLSKMGRGVIDPVYIPEVEGFDPEVNSKSISEVIKRFL